MKKEGEDNSEILCYLSFLWWFRMVSSSCCYWCVSCRFILFNSWDSRCSGGSSCSSSSSRGSGGSVCWQWTLRGTERRLRYVTLKQTVTKIINPILGKRKWVIAAANLIHSRFTERFRSSSQALLLLTQTAFHKFIIKLSPFYWSCRMSACLSLLFLRLQLSWWITLKIYNKMDIAL